MITQLLLLRFHQAYRILKEIGLLLLFLLVFVSIGFLTAIFSFLSTVDFRVAVIIGSVICLSLHLSRKDRGFLLLHAQSPLELKLLFVVEYFLLMTPFYISTLIVGNWDGVAGFLISWIPPLLLPNNWSLINLKKNNPELAFIPDQLFELKGGFRQHWPLLTFSYILGFFSFLHIAFFIVSIFGIGLYLSQFFIPVEPKEILRLSKSFLQHKISTYIKYIFLYLSPIFGLCLGFNYEFYIVVIAAVIFILLILIFSICYKYANYRPGIVAINQSTFQAVYLVFLLLPGLQLVNLVICFIFWRKANINLKNYI